jgi:drug/metabolite transporter (DMT)-like permease
LIDAASALRLLTLGALWGGSFALVAMAVPHLGPVTLIVSRLGLAALFLAAVAVALRRRLDVRRDAAHFLLVGTLNSALPFLLFAYAALTLPASLLALFNALAPAFTAALAALWLRTPIARSVGLGLALGFAGVALLSVEAVLESQVVGGAPRIAAALAAALAAPFLYGVVGVYLKARAIRTDPFDNALGAMIAASLVAAPLVFLAPPTAMPPPAVWLAAGALGVLCTGAAYLLNFRLIADIGPTRAMTVTYLIPLFGALWAVLLLDERVRPGLLVGGPLILAGTALTTGLLRLPPVR